MPRQKTIHCPSGLELIIRSRMARDYDILASDDRDKVERYMEAITLQCLHRGPYPDSQFTQDGKPRMSDNFLMGDWWAIRFEHDELNFPNRPIEKTFVCDADACGYFEKVRLFMGDHGSTGGKCDDGIYRMKVRMLTPENAEVFSDGGEFKTAFLDRQIRFRLATRASLELAGRHMRDEDGKRRKYTTLTASRIMSVDGVGESFEEIREWVGSLDEPDEDELQATLESYDCGPDWTLWPYCPNCEEYVPFEIVADEHFFSRGRQKQKRRRSLQ
jgi:hypothetical protein